MENYPLKIEAKGKISSEIEVKKKISSENISY